MSARLLSLLAIALVGADASAQVRAPGVMRAPATPPSTSSTMTTANPAAGAVANWQSWPGCVTSLAANDATLWAIGCDAAGAEGNAIYRMPLTAGASWQRVPGAGVRIAVQPNGIAWVVTKSGQVHITMQPDGADPAWRRLEYLGMGPLCARAVAPDSLVVFVLGCEEGRAGWRTGMMLVDWQNGPLDVRRAADDLHCIVASSAGGACPLPLIPLHRERKGSPDPMHALVAERATITAGNSYRLWSADATGAVSGLDVGSAEAAMSGSWSPLPGCARALANGRSGLWAVGCSALDAGGNAVMRWTGTAWQEVAGTGAVGIAQAPGGRVWVFDRAGTVKVFAGATP
jgi:hypothetical protein